MILLENALLPDEALVSDELKLVLALIAGGALWFVTTQAEHLIVQIFGAAAGTAVGAMVYNVAAHLAFVAPEFLIVSLMAGAFVGYAGAGYMEKGAYIVLYSISGGFLVMSAMSYFMWKHGASRGDLWITHIASPKHSIDPADGTFILTHVRAISMTLCVFYRDQRRVSVCVARVLRGWNRRAKLAVQAGRAGRGEETGRGGGRRGCLRVAQIERSAGAAATRNLNNEGILIY